MQILYTDDINIVVNADGVTLNVTQKIPGSEKREVVARIGMSRRQATKLVEKLGHLLLSTGNEITPKSSKKLVN